MKQLTFAQISTLVRAATQLEQAIKQKDALGSKTELTARCFLPDGRSETFDPLGLQSVFDVKVPREKVLENINARKEAAEQAIAALGIEVIPG